MTTSFTIRPMDAATVQLALDWAAQEGWNPGLHDAAAFYATDPAGFLVAELDGEPMGSISVVRYSQTFGFIGLYIVSPQWRGRGYGLQLWKTAWQQLVDRLDPEQASIGLDGVVEREATYRQAGFRPTYRHVRYQCQPRPAQSRPDAVVPLAQVPLAQIVQYEAALFPAARPQFLEAWIRLAGAAYGVMEGDRLVGYGVLRPCRHGFKIGPLFADSWDIADALFQALTHHAAAQPVFIDIPDIHPALPRLVQRYQLQPVFTCVRMYWGKPPKLDVDRIFGVTSLELG